MNDRVSAAPPADFLGTGDLTETAEYEKQFALDWKPPELQLEGTYSNIPGNRNSFSSVRSGISSFTTRTGTGTSSVWSKTPTPKHGSSGFFSRVGERFGLHRSQSMGMDEGSSDDSWGHNIPPAYKHKRSESVNSGAAAFLKRDVAAERKRQSANAISFSSSSSAVSVPPAGPVIPGFDPTRRPTRDEITANYQGLLASGFFGTHAIQSTRFAPPGQKLNQQNRTDLSFAQRMAEDDDQHQQRDISHPPSPERQPPPPPPSRVAPPPPPPMFMPAQSSTPSASKEMPTSPTVIFNPVLSGRPSSECMPPPPTLPKTKPDHKANLSFSAVPYSSTRPGAEPSVVGRPYRPPPVSLARFSVDSSRRSYDYHAPQRGTKRPYTATANTSQASISTDTTRVGDNGFTDSYMDGTTDEKPESGARKLVKKLRKSASRLSIDLSKNSSRQSSIPRASDNNNDNINGCQDTSLAPSARMSLSSTVRRSFSWKLGKLGTENTTTTTEIFNVGDNNGDTPAFVLNNNGMNRPAAPHVPSTHELGTTTTAPLMDLSIAGDHHTNTERSRPKNREFRGRLLRKHRSPVKQAPLASPPPTATADINMSMDWQSNSSKHQAASRSRSRSRSTRPGTAHSTDNDSFEYTSTTAGASSGDGGDISMMEGVEFSFHFPGRTRPGGPLTMVPDANRGIPNSVSNTRGDSKDKMRTFGFDSTERIRNNGRANAAAWPPPRLVLCTDDDL